MTPQEALKLLKGTVDEKHQLYSHLIDSAKEQPLEDWQVSMLEALRKEFFPEPKIVEMSATLIGQAKAGT